jgi:hypothetical protein
MRRRLSVRSRSGRGSLYVAPSSERALQLTIRKAQVLAPHHGGGKSRLLIENPPKYNASALGLGAEAPLFAPRGATILRLAGYLKRTRPSHPTW